MASFSIGEHVEAPPEVVFAVASDFPRAAEFFQGIERIELEPADSVGVGTRIRETRVMFGKESTVEKKITAFDSPHCFVVETDSCGCHYRVEQTFVGDIAGTHVRLKFEMRPMSFFAKLMSPLARLMMGSMKKCNAADLSDLKKAAEAIEEQADSN